VFDTPAVFRAYLDEHPEDLGESLRRIVPQGLHEAVDLAGWGFIDDLYYEGSDHPEKGLMTKAASAVRADVDGLEETYREGVKQGRKVDAIRNVIETIKSKPIINFLSTHNIIPKYGFPVRCR